MTDGAAGAQWLVLGRDDDLDAEIGVVDERLEGVGAVRRRQDDPRHAGVARTGDLVHGERHPRDGQHRLGRVDGEGAKARALPTDEEHGFSHVARVPHPGRSDGGYGADVTDVWSLLQRRRRDGAGAPLVTFVDAATGERTELSAVSLENAAAKIANALRDEYDLGPGADDRAAAAAALAAVGVVRRCLDGRLPGRAGLNGG